MREKLEPAISGKPPFPDGELQSSVELGAVTHQSVRVWVRQPDTGTVEAVLEVDGRPPVSETIHLTAETDWTGSVNLALPEPAPGKSFICRVAGTRLPGRLYPDPGSSSHLTFAFGSCHEPFKLDEQGEIVYNSGAGIYPAILEDLERAKAEFIVLGGDQVYSDTLRPISVREILTEDDDHPPPLGVVIDAYRDIYRGFLGFPEYLKLRQRYPTYCMWDDHDIFDNWGSRRTESALDRRLFEAASRVYCEYQHTRNPGAMVTSPPYNYHFRYGTIGFLMLDLRGVRDYQTGQLLGTEQWTAIRDFLNNEARDIETLFIGSSIPIAHVSRWMAVAFDRLWGRAADSVRDRWCASSFVKQRDELLHALFQWQNESDDRQVVFLSGDVHVASASTVRQTSGPGIIQQFTSSAFSTPADSFERYLNFIAVRAPNLFEPNFRFERHFLRFENNFGLVRATPLPTGGHNVEFLVRGWDHGTRRLKTVGKRLTSPAR